jgi:hypothetical protein
LDRIEGYHALLGGPVPDATQGDQIERGADGGDGVLQPLEGLAAQGERIHQDDTAVRLVARLKDTPQMRAQAAAQGFSRPKERPGMFPTAWGVTWGERTIGAIQFSERGCQSSLKRVKGFWSTWGFA